MLVLVGACRIGFDPTTGSDDTPGGSSNGDGGTMTGNDGSLTIDAQPAACAEATTVALGLTLLDTCTGNQNRIDGCASGSTTNEIVIHFRPTVTKAYTFAAYDAGTQNVSNSTARMNADCVTIQSCNGITGTTLTAGVDYYFVVEASSGACADIEFSIQ